MSRSSFVDFKAVKAAITMEQVLQHYGILDQFKKSESQKAGVRNPSRCPRRAVRGRLDCRARRYLRFS